MKSVKQRKTRRKQRRSINNRHRYRRQHRDYEEVQTLATVVDYVPDAKHSDGLTNLADALVLQMFELPLGETLRLAYTIVQTHQERHTRRRAISTATEALRDHLAHLEDMVDDP